MLQSDSGEQNPQIVGYFGDGADLRARVRPCGLLLDGNRGRQPANGLVLGLLHLAEKLARVGGERFNVASLSFGVEGVEGQRGLAGAGDSGQHRQLFFGDLDVDVLEVVLAGTLDEYVV